ncbi:MAG: pyridoxamine 5'-phosphate oxidase family protein [Pyrinomonadaceae bacterium]
MKVESIWDKPASHGEILKKIWKHLDLGVLERDHPFHTPVFGTVASGCTPNLRIIVLRRFWRRNPRGLAFHTHLGAPKIKEIEANANVSFIFYHPPEKLQLRVKGRATIHTSGELHEEQWRATSFFSRRCYAGDSPSQISPKPTSGLPAELVSRQPSKEESENGNANFVVVSSTVDSIDCLELDVKGNRRSLFSWNVVGELETKWLTP